jgi:hypothetical protein
MVMAFDFAGYKSDLDLGKRFMYALALATAASGFAFIPYFIMSPKSKRKDASAKDKREGTLGIPVAAVVWLLIMLATGSWFAGWGAGPLQGMIISLMYMALSSFMGYNVNASKKDPKARGSTLFALAIYVLLLAFALAGFKQTRGSNKGNAKGNANGNGNGNAKGNGNGNAKGNAPPPAMGVSGTANMPVEPTVTA